MPLPPLPSRRALLGWLGASLLPTARAAADLPAPMLAREAPVDLDPSGWLVSEKFDGVRARWDGRALWFRSGRPISAPPWFMAALPAGTALEGELWLGRGRFERLAASVRRREPVDAEWRGIHLMAFDMPARPEPFAERYRRLLALPRSSRDAVLKIVPQERVQDSGSLQRRLSDVTGQGGEGLMLHRADALYEPGRSGTLLKLKSVNDAEARVLGPVAGQGRLSGQMGALRVQTPEGIKFVLGTGFSDAERRQPPQPGSWVTYSYRGRTAQGVPRFASFMRVRDEP